MKFSQLARYFYLWGWQIKHEHYSSFMEYCQEMLKRNRVIIIQKAGEVEGIIFFYLTDNYKLLYKKPLWSIAQDNPDGSQIYIDKMVCKRYTKELRKSLQDAIESKFPQVELGIYHRAPKDRCYKVYRRRQHVQNKLCFR